MLPKEALKAIRRAITAHYKSKIDLLFRIRRKGWDSNPRSFLSSSAFKADAIDHSTTFPCFSFFRKKALVKTGFEPVTLGL